MSKERIEVLGGGRMAVIDDFREIITASNGKINKQKTTGKGHQEEVQAFINAVRLNENAPIRWDELRTVSLASILAVNSLRDGIPFEI